MKISIIMKSGSDPSVATAFEGEFLHDGKRKIAHLRPGKRPMLDSYIM